MIGKTKHLLGALIVTLGLAMIVPWAVAASPDSNICPIHKEKMAPARLRLMYGMPSAREFDELRVAKPLFPYGRDYVLAGCVVKPAKTVEGFICPKCVVARERWLKVEKMTTP
jgi:hypothetical protein